jgi:hypothetical protein
VRTYPHFAKRERERGVAVSLARNTQTLCEYFDKSKVNWWVSSKIVKYNNIIVIGVIHPNDRVMMGGWVYGFLGFFFLGEGLTPLGFKPRRGKSID